jgi:hypothetical protein
MAGTSVTNITAVPHPFNDQTTISTDTKEKIISVKIFNINGREISNSAKVNSETVTLGENLSAGYYIIQVITNTGIYFKTLIKF